MWPRRYFAARYFAPTYFPQSQGVEPPIQAQTTSSSVLYLVRGGVLELFNALEARFNYNPTLRVLGRRLYEGFDEQRVNVVRPYVEVNLTLVERLDTFSTDVEVWDLPFRYHAKDLRTRAANEWIAAMIETFKDADIVSPFFKTAGCRMLGASVPSLRDGSYNAVIRFQLTLERQLTSPIDLHG